MFARGVPCICLVVILALCPAAYSVKESRPHTPPPASLLGSVISNAPMILSSGGDTTWIQVHTDSTYCPGDPAFGHGGEATGGPGPLETWCFEGGPGDSCGTNPPWDTSCFDHLDVRTSPSPSDTNYWHLDTYRADQRPYCGNYCLWCGSDSLWIDGYPVDCETWSGTPGYGDSWNCIVQLTLPPTFDIANGCTLFFDPRYDTECKYDYFYMDFYNGTEWKTLATFNASSNNPGAECGPSSGGNPDYWGNTDTDQPYSADWQERTNPAEPAFGDVIIPDSLLVVSGPIFRWRFTSDGAWSDADGRGNTDGGAFIDNVWIWGDDERYAEDFETGVLDTNYWSLPNPDGVADAWHIQHDPDPLYEGDEPGYDPYTCTNDSSSVYRARPTGGYPSGADWRNQWYYRLVSPRIPIQNTGCIVQYDIYCLTLDYTCDYGRFMYRFYSNSNDRWCPWRSSPDGLSYSWCSQYFWWRDHSEPVGYYYGSDADSVQFCWELEDVSFPGSFCEGKHKSTDFQVDNVSVGFYDASSTIFRASNLDLLHDTFHDNLCAYNSSFDANDPDTVGHYSGPPYDDVPLRRDHQLLMDVLDKDGLASVELYGSTDMGVTWVAVSMILDWLADPDDPSKGGEYWGTLCPDDFGLDAWEVGTEVRYFVKALDILSNEEYFPAPADPGHPGHTGGPDDYLTFSILPLYPGGYTGPRILLVDGSGEESYDWAPCLTSVSQYCRLEDIYEQVLTDAGYCYDKYDVNGAGSSVSIEPTDFDEYHAVVWFTGSRDYYMFSAETGTLMVDYLNNGGKFVLCGDRVAYALMDCPPGYICAEDILDQVICAEYLEEMPSPFEYPYVYAAAEDTIDVFGTPVAIDLDTLLIYRQCPSLTDLSYLQAGVPADSCVSQSVMHVANPITGDSDQVIYSEFGGVGQIVLINFDLGRSVNHSRAYCDGVTPHPAPGFSAGTYDGRVELMRVILEDLLGLASNGGGTAKVVEPPSTYSWALSQNSPNPCVADTEIRFVVAQRCRVKIRIYNAVGQTVRLLEDSVKSPGNHAVRWGGRNTSGERVSSGVYFYKIEAGPFTATRKMLVLR